MNQERPMSTEPLTATPPEGLRDEPLTRAGKALLDLRTITVPVCCGLSFEAHDERVTGHVVKTTEMWDAQLHDFVDNIEAQAIALDAARKAEAPSPNYGPCPTRLDNQPTPSARPWRYGHAASIEGAHWDIYAGEGIDGWLVGMVTTEADAALIVEAVNARSTPAARPAEGLDVERLARAIGWLNGDPTGTWPGWQKQATALLAEYARLGADRTEEPRE